MTEQTKHDRILQVFVDETDTYIEYIRADIVAEQLAEREKQNVLLRGFVKLLRDYIPASAIGNMTVQDALDATADLSGLILCDAEPISYIYKHRSSYTGEFIWKTQSTYNGNQAIATLPLYKAKEI